MAHLLTNSITRRYRDKERSKSPDVVTSAPTFKVDDIKKPISVKATTAKPLSAASTAPASRTAKKIDMGAALNYGKPSDLGINSPTHRNTHNEDLFGDEPVVSKASATRSNNDIIEDIFSSAAVSSDPADDFDPRAEEKTADFGDFASAFGGNEVPTIAPAAMAPVAPANEFADFSAAFTMQKSAPVDNFLFNTAPAPPQSNSSADLFGNSVITSAFTSPTGATNKDLLSDFGDLTLNPIQGKHLGRQLRVLLN
jgi:clathrin interactor 1